MNETVDNLKQSTMLNKLKHSEVKNNLYKQKQLFKKRKNKKNVKNDIAEIKALTKKQLIEKANFQTSLYKINISFVYIILRCSQTQLLNVNISSFKNCYNKYFYINN